MYVCFLCLTIKTDFKMKQLETGRHLVIGKDEVNMTTSKTV